MSRLGEESGSERVRPSGCGTALVTPFAADGSVDEDALRALVDWQITSGIDFLVPCGTTGEASTLTQEETLRVVSIVVEKAAGRVPVFAGCTHNATVEAVQRVRRLSEVAGLSGILTANPYYNRPAQEGQYLHFRAIAEATLLPVLLYNIPPRTGANLEPATVVRLAESCSNIVGIKESSGSVVQITDVLARLKAAGLEAFAVFAGDDALALPVMALGGVGLISVASNALPAEYAEMINAASKGDWKTAAEINLRFFRLSQAHFAEPNPAPVKAVLALRGRGADVLRLPMTPVTEPMRERLRALVDELRLGPQSA